MSAHADRVAVLTNAPMAALRRTRDAAAQRGDADMANAALHAMQRRAVSQTAEIENCGQLFEHIETIGRAPSQRTIARYTGDPAAWMAPFMTGATAGKINRDAGVVEQTVRLRAGERVQIVKG